MSKLLQTNARYSEILESLLEDLHADKVLREDAEDDWSGSVDVDVLLKDGRIFSCSYAYGSCSGCDEWEDTELEDDEIKEELLDRGTFFKDIDVYNKWRGMVNANKDKRDDRD